MVTDIVVAIAFIILFFGTANYIGMRPRIDSKKVIVLGISIALIISTYGTLW